MNRSCRYSIFLGMVAGAGLAVAAQGQSQWTGVYSEDQAKRGETAFADKCSSCHANDLSGDAVDRPRPDTGSRLPHRRL